MKGWHYTLTFLFALILLEPSTTSAQQTPEPTGAPTAGAVSDAAASDEAVSDAAASGAADDLEGIFFGVSNINVVNVDVYVTDKEGEPVTGLTMDDFEVFEDGDAVELTNFYAVAGGGRPVQPVDPTSTVTEVDLERPRVDLEELLPADERLHLIIYIDNKNIHPATRNRVLNRMHRFLRSELSRGDRVMVVSYDQSITVRQHFTSDMDLVEEALEEISGLSGSATLRDSERRSAMEDIDEAEDVLRAIQIARSYADSVYAEMNFTFDGLEKQISVLSGLNGRKAILHVSDGLPRTIGEDLFIFVDEKFRRSNARLEAAVFDVSLRYRDLVSKANAGDVTFYTLEATGLGAHQSISADFGGTVDGGSLAFIDSIRAANLQEPLHTLAGDTGGMSFTNTNAVEMSLGRVAKDFKNYYSLGYRPPHYGDGRYYKIEVKAKRKDLVVRHRNGYRDRTSEAHLADGSVATLYFGGERNPLEAEIVFGRPGPQGRHYVLPMSIKLPLNHIVLAPQGDFYIGRIKISLVVMDEEGGTSPVQPQDPVTIRIPKADIETARQQLYVYDLGLTVRKGYSRIAIGIRDELSAETSFLRHTVNVGG